MLNLKELLIEKISHFLRMSKNKPSFDKSRPLPQGKANRFVWILAIFLVVGAGMLLQKKLWKLSRKQNAIRRSVKKLKNRAIGTPYYLGELSAPLKFSLIPYGEDTGLVVGVKKVNIRNVIAPYNASLVESKSGYDLFFRYDIISSRAKYARFYSHIGVVHLNDQFEQENKEFKRIDLQTEYAEDPRAVLINDQLHLFYNTLDNKNLRNRFMCVANLDRESFQVNYNTILDMNLQWIEKNWSPFEYIGVNQEPQFLIEYQISPRKLLKLSDPRMGEIKSLRVPKEVSYLSLLWPNEWGSVRGGTPAKKIGNEYLGFFHSSFKEDNGLVWYVMGAYTFEAHHPFRITGISNHPILFRGIFDTPYINTASLDKRVIFPSGFVLEKQKDKELIHVACGENDSAVKIITLDKEKLLESMNRFEH